jgi:hypothetical protein
MPSLRALLTRLTCAEPAELAASLWSFIYFFSLLAGYYVLRPIRDEMAIQVGQAKLHELFLGVFVTMLVVAPVFGWLTRTFPRRRLLPWLYAFFVANLGVLLGIRPDGQCPHGSDLQPRRKRSHRCESSMGGVDPSRPVTLPESRPLGKAKRPKTGAP